MRIRRFDDADTFYQHTESFLLAHEAENNLPFGLIAMLRKDPNRYGETPPYFASAERDGKIVLVALRTPPFRLVIAQTESPTAIERLAQDVLDKYGADMPGVTSITPVSKAFAETWHSLTGKPYRSNMAQRIFRLDTVVPVTGVPGNLRRMAEGDFPIVREWIKGFQEEAVHEASTDEQAQKMLERFHHSDEVGIFLWEVGGEIVSLAASNRPTLNGISVGPVYTPVEHRRKGYASACVAALSQKLLDDGYQFCTLYTDLSNPTSNHIYQQIGYTPICDSDEYAFG